MPTDPRLRRLHELDEERHENALRAEFGLAKVGGRFAGPGPLDLVDLSADPGDPEWLVDGFLARESLALLGGPPGQGKTWAAMTLALCASSGMPFLSHEVHDRQRVLYLDFENGKREVHRRFLALGGTHASVTPYLQIASLEAKITSPACWDQVRRQVEVFGPDLVIIDTFSSGVGIDENDVQAVELFYETTWTPLRRRGSSLLLLHHTRKGQPGGRERGIERFRGSGHIAGRVDRAWLLDKVSGDRIRFSDVKARQHAEADDVFLELAEPGDQPGGIRLRRSERVTPVARLQPARLDRKAEIRAVLARGAQTASLLAKELGISVVAVRKHLLVMIDAGAVVKDGVTFRLATDATTTSSP